MTLDSETTIQNTYSSISTIFKEAASQKRADAGKGLLQVLEKMTRQDDHQSSVHPARSESDLRASSSLEKVGFYIDLALDTFETIQGPHLNSEQRVSFVFALSETHETLGNYQRALSNYESALHSCHVSKNRSMEGQIQHRRARIYSEMGEWQKAEQLLNEAIISLQVAGNEKEIGLAQIELAKLAFRRGKYAAAEDLFQEALSTAEQVNDLRARADISNHLGVIRRMEGKFDVAYMRFQEALLEFQGIQDYRGTADSMNNLGVLHMLKQERQDAIGYFDKALRLCQEVGYYPLLPFVYLNKTEYYCEEQDYPMAANTCGRALENLARLKNPIGIAKTTLLFGRIFWKSSDLVTSKKFYLESIRLYEEFDIPFGLANCCLEFSQMLKQKGDHEGADRYHSRGQSILSSIRTQADSDVQAPKVEVVERRIVEDESVAPQP